MAKSAAQLTGDSRGHMIRLLTGLTECGWLFERVPQDLKVPRNGMRLVLMAGNRQIKLRVFCYKVTTSGRKRPEERRVEVTTTYKGNLKKIRGYSDVVLAYDFDSEKYVGVDPRRLRIGGHTHNASSFFDRAGLASSVLGLSINPRPAAAKIFRGGSEFHAYFEQGHLSEYLFNVDEIHAGTYRHTGLFSGKTKRRKIRTPLEVDPTIASGNAFILSATATARKRPSTRLIKAVEEDDFSFLSKKGMSPETLMAIQAACREVGDLGEQLVLEHERRTLYALGHVRAAARVERVSLRSVGAGFDIASFESDGTTRRLIEVKSTVGSGLVVDVSAGEWAAALRHKNKYYIARVINVRKSPRIIFFRDPAKLQTQKAVTITASGWKLDLSSAPKVR